MQAQTTYRPLALTVFSPTSTLQRYLFMAALVIGGSLFVAACAQIHVTLPFTPVPITGQTFAVLTVGGLLGARLGAASLLLYLAEGCYGMLWGSKTTGLHFFSEGTFGWQIIEGPTGGYIVGFILAAFVIGWLAERGLDRNPLTMALAMLGANLLIYVPGLIWLDHWFYSNVPTYTGNVLEVGFYPYVLGDTAKMLLAAGILPLAWGVLRQLPGYKKAFPELTGEVKTRDYRVPLAWVYLPIAAIVLVGCVLPWGTAESGKHVGLSIEGGQYSAIAACIAIVLSAIALSKRVPWEITRVGLFSCGAVAGFASFYQMSRILEARSETFALSPLGIGLIISGIASVALASASLLDRKEDQQPTLSPVDA
ncbi:MAG: biotin transporter BioY [Chloroflexota bacterium]